MVYAMEILCVSGELGTEVLIIISMYFRLQRAKNKHKSNFIVAPSISHFKNKS
jgi:hypothetical protein